MVEKYRIKEGIAKGREMHAAKHAQTLEAALAEYKRFEAHVGKLTSDAQRGKTAKIDTINKNKKFCFTTSPFCAADSSLSVA